MRVGIDIDDVCYAWSERIHAYCEAAGITNGKTITQWAFHNDYGIERGELWDHITKAYRHGILLEPPYPGVAYQLGRLRAAGHTVHLATARGFEPDVAGLVRRDTEKWVTWWGIPHDSLTFTADKVSVGCDVFLDDSPKNVRELRAAGVNARLRDQPHNRGAVDLDRYRVGDLALFAAGVLARFIRPMVPVGGVG